MFVIECSIFYLAVGVMMGRVACLVELPEVEDNDIKNAELAIRTTTNTLFSTLKLQSKKGRSRLQYFTLVHHYLTSLTLEDYTTLREIAKLTRVDKKAINNRTQHFITALTEVLDDESNNLVTQNHSNFDSLDEADRFIEEYMKELEYKVYYSNHSYDSDIEIVKLLMVQESINNATNTIQRDMDVWKPSPLDLLRSGRRIFKGKGTKIKYYPFMASVQAFNRFMCGGSIIKADLVITAASCLQLAYNNRLYRENPAFLSVRVGSTFYEGSGEQIEVLEVFFHPSYDPKKLHNNIAIMRLRRKIHFKTRHVKKIEIDREESALPAVTDGILVLGWGARSESNKIYNAAENKLSSALLDFYPLEECKEIYSKEYVTRRHFCGGFFSNGGGACNRDVGGPGVVGGVLVGIISFGSPICGAPDAPTVFTKVGYYSKWIDEIMEQEVPDGYAVTTRSPATRSWNVSNVDRAIYYTDIMKLSPVNEGTPYPLVPIKQDINAPNENKNLLKTLHHGREGHFTSQTPSDSSEELSSTVKFQSEAEMSFSLTTFTTPPEEIDDLNGPDLKLRTEMSENLFTPETPRSDEYSSSETTSPNNMGTIDKNSESKPGKLMNEVLSMAEKMEITEEDPKDKSYKQPPIIEDKLSQDQKSSYYQNTSEYVKPLQDQNLSYDQKYTQDKNPSQDQNLFYDQKYLQDKKSSQDQNLSYDQKYSQDKNPSQDQNLFYDQKYLQDKKSSQDQNLLYGQKYSQDKKPSQVENLSYDQKYSQDKKPSQDQNLFYDQKYLQDKKFSQDQNLLYGQKYSQDKKPSQVKNLSYDQKYSLDMKPLKDQNFLYDQTYSQDKKPSQDQNFLYDQEYSQDKKPWYEQKPTFDNKPLYHKKPSQDQKSSQGKKASQDKKLSPYMSSRDKQLSQDTQPLQYKKPLRKKKPPVLHMKEIIQLNSPQDTLPQDKLLQEIPQGTFSEEMLASNTLLPQVSSAVMSLPDQLLPEPLLPKKLSSEIESHEVLKSKANEEGSEEKYSSNDKSPDVREDVSGSRSGSESEFSAMPIEIESGGENKKSAENKLKKAHDDALREEMFGMLMSNTTYPTEEPFSDSELVDPQLSLAPSLAKNIRKGNQTDIDKTILTLLYLSDNETENHMNGLLDTRKPPPTDTEGESTSGEDIKTKTKKNLVYRSINVDKDSDKFTMNEEFSSHILFDILKEAVKNDIFTDNLKNIKKLRKKV